jgi:NADPH-dependent 2,4-dienoyl-CoA reductase/sulfur reductase-like enzyme
MASSIKMGFKDINVSVVAPEKTPLQNVFGEKVASVLQKLAEKNGVNFFTSAKIKGVEGEGNIKAVALEGNQIPTDLLIVATGVESAIDFAKGL